MKKLILIIAFLMSTTVVAQNVVKPLLTQFAVWAGTFYGLGGIELYEANGLALKVLPPPYTLKHTGAQIDDIHDGYVATRYYTDGIDTFYTSVGSDKITLYNDADQVLITIDSIGNVVAGITAYENRWKWQGPNYNVSIANGGVTLGSGTSLTYRGGMTNSGGNVLMSGRDNTDDVYRFKFNSNTGDNNYIGNPFNYWADTSTVANLYGINTTVHGTVELPTGTHVYINIATQCTGASTLRINANTTGNILKLHDVALASGDIEAGQIIHLIYDGTNFQMLSQLAQ